MLRSKHIIASIVLIGYFGCTPAEDTLVGWGDSMMKASLSEVSLLDVIEDELGIATINFGQGSLRSRQIAFLQGGLPMYLTPDSIQDSDQGTLFMPFDDVPFNSFGIQEYSGKIDDARGDLKRLGVADHPGQTAHLIFSEPLDHTALTSKSILFSFDHADTYRKSPTLIWAGRNDHKTQAGRAAVLDNVKAMVAYLEGRAKTDYLILGICNGRSTLEPKGTAAYRDILALNDTLASHFGSHYIDVRSVMINEALPLLNLEPTDEDTYAISKGCIPDRFFADEVHFNELGNIALGRYLARLISEKAWLN